MNVDSMKEVPAGLGFYEYIEQIEMAVIQSTLHQCHGNKALAAKKLKLNRTTLSMMIRKYKITYEGGAVKYYLYDKEGKYVGVIHATSPEDAIKAAKENYNLEVAKVKEGEETPHGGHLQ